MSEYENEYEYEDTIRISTVKTACLHVCVLCVCI